MVPSLGRRCSPIGRFQIVALHLPELAFWHCCWFLYNTSFIQWLVLDLTTEWLASSITQCRLWSWEISRFFVLLCFSSLGSHISCTNLHIDPTEGSTAHGLRTFRIGFCLSDNIGGTVGSPPSPDAFFKPYHTTEPLHFSITFLLIWYWCFIWRCCN